MIDTLKQLRADMTSEHPSMQYIDDGIRRAAAALIASQNPVWQSTGTLLALAIYQDMPDEPFRTNGGHTVVHVDGEPFSGLTVKACVSTHGENGIVFSASVERNGVVVDEAQCSIDLEENAHEV